MSWLAGSVAEAPCRDAGVGPFCVPAPAAALGVLHTGQAHILLFGQRAQFGRNLAVAYRQAVCGKLVGLGVGALQLDIQPFKRLRGNLRRLERNLLLGDGFGILAPGLVVEQNDSD